MAYKKKRKDDRRTSRMDHSSSVKRVGKHFVDMATHMDRMDTQQYREKKEAKKYQQQMAHRKRQQTSDNRPFIVFFELTKTRQRINNEDVIN